MKTYIKRLPRCKAIQWDGCTRTMNEIDGLLRGRPLILESDRTLRIGDVAMAYGDFLVFNEAYRPVPVVVPEDEFRNEWEAEGAMQ